MPRRPNNRKTADYECDDGEGIQIVAGDDFLRCHDEVDLLDLPGIVTRDQEENAQPLTAAIVACDDIRQIYWLAANLIPLDESSPLHLARTNVELYGEDYLELVPFTARVRDLPECLTYVVSVQPELIRYEDAVNRNGTPTRAFIDDVVLNSPIVRIPFSISSAQRAPRDLDFEGAEVTYLSGDEEDFQGSWYPEDDVAADFYDGGVGDGDIDYIEEDEIDELVDDGRSITPYPVESTLITSVSPRPVGAVGAMDFAARTRANSGKSYFKSGSRLNQKEKAYCRCLVHVSERGSATNPYAVCTRSTGRQGRVDCGGNYDFNKFSNEELKKYARTRKVGTSGSRSQIIRRLKDLEK